jgi:hypothetical protein
MPAPIETAGGGFFLAAVAIATLVELSERQAVDPPPPLCRGPDAQVFPTASITETKKEDAQLTPTVQFMAATELTLML